MEKREPIVMERKESACVRVLPPHIAARRLTRVHPFQFLTAQRAADRLAARMARKAPATTVTNINSLSSGEPIVPQYRKRRSTGDPHEKANKVARFDPETADPTCGSGPSQFESDSVLPTKAGNSSTAKKMRSTNTLPHTGILFQLKQLDQNRVTISPFSFDSQTQEYWLKKEQKVKEYLEGEKVQQLEMMFKAQPIRKYTPVKVQDSVKPLTVPVSPAFTVRIPRKTTQQ